MFDRDPFAGPTRRRRELAHLRGRDGFLSAADEIAFYNRRAADNPRDDASGAIKWEKQVEGAVAEPVEPAKSKDEEPMRTGKRESVAE